MAIGSSTILTALSIASAASSLIGGMQSKGESDVQAGYAMEAARARAAETERLAQREARLEQEEVDKTQRKQMLAYLSSGVALEGSPLLVMEETRAKGADNINEILQAGKSGSQAALMEGRIQAQRSKSAGREAFAQGLTSAAGSVARLF